MSSLPNNHRELLILCFLEGGLRSDQGFRGPFVNEIIDLLESKVIAPSLRADG